MTATMKSMRAVWVGLLVGLMAVAPAARQSRNPRGRLFPPEELGRLAPPDRDEWQQPDRIMDALRIAEGDKVADVAAGGGWFTIRLANRVGPNGMVYAEDIQAPMIDSIDRAKERAGLKNVQTILGLATNPRLPRGLHTVIIVDSYAQLQLEPGDPVAMLRNIAAALAPNGQLGIVDFKNDGAGGPGSREMFLRYQYLLIFGK